MKKLRRNLSNRMIAGVCAGIADYFGLDVTLIRLVFVLLGLSALGGVVLYVILWILMPISDGSKE